jgi:hypothetical protein
MVLARLPTGALLSVPVEYDDMPGWEIPYEDYLEGL